MCTFVASILLVIPLLTAATPSHNVDPKDIALIEGRRYYFSTIGVTVPEAVSVCQEINMTLAGLETPEEFTAVTDYAKNNITAQRLRWTSGCHQHTSWLWSNSGQLFSYFKWGSGNPMNTEARSQTCLTVSSDTCEMYDRYCDNNNYFICEERSC